MQYHFTVYQYPHVSCKPIVLKDENITKETFLYKWFNDSVCVLVDQKCSMKVHIYINTLTNL
jgi:hypothetical protein